MPVVNLADPSCEPSDEQLQELSKRAFADVPATNERTLRMLRAEISEGRGRLQSQLKKAL
jgi:hypothetical protein